MSDSEPVGEPVRRLRIALGMSQTELAERAGVSAGAMSMIETNRLSATSEVIESLADVLDCTPAYLRGAPHEAVVGRPWLRAYADAPSRVVERVLSDSVTAVSAAEALKLRFVADDVPAFDGDLNDDDEIEEFATLVRVQAGVTEDAVIGNAIRAAERLGCVVLPMDSELGRHLGISTRVNSVPVIRVSRPGSADGRGVPGDRQRFTVAHELGHLALHHARRPPDSASDAAKIEKQAHRFAAAFLAPAEPLLTDFDRLGGRATLSVLAELKEVWGIAIKALVLRLRHLSVIDDDHARSLYKQISARGWNKNEPVPVATESAVWLQKALKQRFGGVGDPTDRACVELGLGRGHFERWITWSVAAEQHQSVAPVVDFTRRESSGSEGRQRQGDATITRLPVRR
ncbi:helix-turn-helix domain-containing protein [Microbacterium sp. ASV49]|uniref:XRE family transcriptional regulator n=1 Tax=Microbacterium candidum TaxID=3041922 RepID=A0ABT7MVW5_9MICO|nr:XRE family transcriptional regulator [Microbacterium sp. ASV49]MDL9978597.1 XRE family transcriptional regulator [Microbacterium sp. ASV49]